ncbi:CRAL/TRIO domain-containing protein [Nannizzia gypsea CBS 118893]|uniref:CRAL/TRIO domain-containing protein n=1 Tax=Arthroderma gypseum (strain ATCC MYA-4604 / CBS 118893) TaxID=535722 RepID=E4UUM4_ARTGP|nr:CRAL/TRIO domain-containing protein [Nannizzia gypsea CBS 118893]EFR00991.1 CRAL/TRIO domain-containing protein [Nannizzia gypsea CBS 118893]
MSLEETANTAKQPPQLNKQETNQSTASAATLDPLSGHLNHLSEKQSEALEAFKQQCIERNIYTPAKDGQKASHDDSTLLRFLRARRFDVNGALGQFQSTEDWRRDNEIDKLYENFDVDSYEEARKVYPQWTGRRDRRGIPIYVYTIKDLNSKNMTAYSSSAASTATSSTHASSKVPARLLRLFALYENMVRFVLPLCSRLDRPNREVPIVNTTNIVDITGVGLKQFWNLKGHMQDASTLATAHYPETLDRIFIIGAPVFFPTVWGWIKRWFDPGTTSKIFILTAAEVQQTLSAFMDEENIPKRYGGKLDWDFGDMPNLDEDARAQIGSLERVGQYADQPEDSEGAAKDTATRKANFVKGPIVIHDDKIDIYGSVKGGNRRKTLPIISLSEKPDIQPAEPESSETFDATVELSKDLEKAALSRNENEPPTANVVAHA